MATPAGPWGKYGGSTQAGPWDKYSQGSGATASPEPPEPAPQPPGFLSRMWTALGDAINNATPAGDWPELGPKFRQQLSDVGHTLLNIPHQMESSLASSGQSLMQGHPLEAAYHAVGAVPLLGPAAQQVGQEADAGKYPEALVHGALMLGGAAAPEMSMPELQSPLTVGPGRFVKPISVQGAAEHFMPTPLKVLSRAARNADEEIPVPAGILRRLQVQSPFVSASERSPIWKGGAPADIPPVSAPEPINPIPPPEGYVRRSPRPTPTPTSRTPLWQSMPDLSPTPRGPINPIPPPEGYVRRSPVDPVQITTNPETVAPMERPNMPPMSAAEAHRYAHVQATEAELPGSPAGVSKGAHDWLSTYAKVKFRQFGVKSWHELSPAQMQSIGDDLLDINRSRVGGIPPVK